jgi:hypothetical protein
MLDLAFSCHGAHPSATAASPTMVLELDVEERSGRRVYGIGLTCQIRVEPVRRRYHPAEEEALLELFGEPGRWADSLKPIQFCTVSTMLAGFTGSTRVELAVPCTYDTEVAAARYCRALTDGEVPLLLLFSGNVYYPGGEGLLVERVPWDLEVHFRLPVAAWRALMEAHFPGSGWLRLQTEALEALLRFRRSRMLATWEDTVSTLLKEAGVTEP